MIISFIPTVKSLSKVWLLILECSVAQQTSRVRAPSHTQWRI